MSHKKRDEDADCRPADKVQVLHDTRIFNETPLNSRRSRILLARVLALLYQGDILSRTEATVLFFAVTKLFQHKDPALRQMVYLVVKELADKADDVLMVTSSLTKDINARSEELFAPASSTAASLLSAAASFGLRLATSSPSSNTPTASPSAAAAAAAIVGTSVCHRADAIRALCKITPASMLPSVERFLKQAIVDKSAAVTSAALVASYHVAVNSLDLVRRWSNEILEAFNSNRMLQNGLYSAIVQYHALGLLYAIRQGDRMATAKLVQSSIKPGLVRSPWAQCMLVRYAVRCCLDESAASGGGRNLAAVSGTLSATMYDYLRQQCNSSDMVMLEAARGICVLVLRDASASLTPAQAQPAINTLQLLLTSPKQALKFAALRTLNRLADVNPLLVAPCNLDMEALVADPNRSVATYAITTLLKTGTESGVDRLMKQIASFMGEIADEFKVIVVDAIRLLAEKFPSKQGVLLGFLSSVLREEGGYEYKRSVVDAIFTLVKSLPECVENALPHLCEFIEDCEFTKLAVRILHLLGTEAPKTRDPTRYIRFIYNRVILENSNVRAAAVNALASIGCAVAAVRPTIVALLRRCRNDADDEVRDRVVYNLVLLRRPEVYRALMRRETVCVLAPLEVRVAAYLAAGDFAKRLDVSGVPLVSRADQFTMYKVGRMHKGQRYIQEQTQQQQHHQQHHHQNRGSASMLIDGLSFGGSSHLHVDTFSGGSSGLSFAASSRRQQFSNPLAEIERVPEFAGGKLGEHFKSSAADGMALTEPEMEYAVSCVKHVFAEHVVFEFKCTNTLDSAVLRRVTVQMTVLSSCGGGGGACSNDGDDNDGDGDGDGDGNNKSNENMDAGNRAIGGARSTRCKLVHEFSVPAAELLLNEPQRTFVCYRIGRRGAHPVCSFSTALRYTMHDRKPGLEQVASGPGVADSYQLEEIDLQFSDYIRADATWVQQSIGGGTFGVVWDSLRAYGDENEVVETLALALPSVQVAVAKVTEVLGLQALEGTGAVVPPSKTSHTLLLGGIVHGGAHVLARVRMVADAVSGRDGSVAMEFAVRSDVAGISEAVIAALSV